MTTPRAALAAADVERLVNAAHRMAKWTDTMEGEEGGAFVHAMREASQAKLDTFQALRAFGVKVTDKPPDALASQGYAVTRSVPLCSGGEGHDPNGGPGSDQCPLCKGYAVTRSEPRTFPLDLDTFIAGLDSPNHSEVSRRDWCRLFFRDMQRVVGDWLLSYAEARADCETRLAGLDATLDRLMALWQEPWSEPAYGEAQMLLSRLRAALAADPEPSDA